MIWQATHLVTGRMKSRLVLFALVVVSIAATIYLFVGSNRPLEKSTNIESERSAKSEPRASEDAPPKAAPPNPVSPTVAAVDNVSSQAYPVKIYFVDPMQYNANHVQFVRDLSGKTRLNTILLPPDLPPATGTSDLKSGGFLGAASCAECHQEYYDSYVQTSHFKTSATADRESILGSFEPNKNRLETKSPNLHFEMESEDGVFLQRMLVESSGESFGADFQFGIVTGSGKIAQSYLYWKDERLYQLPVSYLTKKNCWVNSPGYLDGTANFARPVLAPCLECHATFFETVGGTTNHFRKDNFILGISCERCHGPGREHVSFHQDNPNEKTGHSITNPNGLSPERSADMCQVCHGGLPSSMKQPAFTYRVGTPLNDHYEFAKSEVAGPVPIHSNSQLPRLRKSRCFQESKSLGCTDCHNPHKLERGDLSLFSDRCMRCHEPNQCGKFSDLGESLRVNCIDCHMTPNQTNDIGFNMEGGVVRPMMRDHHIRISQEATAEYLRTQPKNR